MKTSQCWCPPTLSNESFHTHNPIKKITRRKVPNLIDKASQYRSWNPVHPKFFAKINNALRFLEDPLLNQTGNMEQKLVLDSCEQFMPRGLKDFARCKPRAASEACNNPSGNRPRATHAKSFATIQNTEP
jgi:hypothetical protein